MLYIFLCFCKIQKKDFNFLKSIPTGMLHKNVPSLSPAISCQIQCDLAINILHFSCDTYRRYINSNSSSFWSMRLNSDVRSILL